MTAASTSYELFTQQVMASLTGVDVHHQRTYTGRRTGRKIKVDVSFNYSVADADLLFLVECKHSKHKVPVDDIEEFFAKLDDIGAHKGIVVTTAGFQSGAVKVAQSRGIALALLTRDRQPGEMIYIVNSKPPSAPKEATDDFWQGNLQGPSDNYSGGFRFAGVSEFLSLLGRDEFERQWRQRVAAFEREHGIEP